MSVVSPSEDPLKAKIADRIDETFTSIEDFDATKAAEAAWAEVSPVLEARDADFRKALRLIERVRELAHACQTGQIYTADLLVELDEEFQRWDRRHQP